MHLPPAFITIGVVVVLLVLWSLYHGLGLKAHLCAVCGRPVRVRNAAIHLRPMDHRDVDTAQDRGLDYLHRGTCDKAYCITAKYHYRDRQRRG